MRSAYANSNRRMIEMLPSKQEQIEALLQHKAYDLVVKYAPAAQLTSRCYESVFSMKRFEILQYVERNYKIEDLVSTVPQQRDGFYAIRGVQGYRVYEQEHQLKIFEQHVSTEHDVWVAFVNYLLETSGTALDFN
jgi:hypothetical protein